MGGTRVATSACGTVAAHAADGSNSMPKPKEPDAPRPDKKRVDWMDSPEPEDPERVEKREYHDQRIDPNDPRNDMPGEAERVK